MTFYAHSHIGIAKSDWHLLEEHLYGTAKAAADFAEPFGADRLAFVAALFHDAGKYSHAFQKRLEGENIRIDHSTAGAVEVAKRYGLLGKLLAYTIAGHHCGLPDWGSVADESALAARLKKKLEDYSAFTEEIKLPHPREINLPDIKPIVSKGFSIQFLIRFVYSCLVDADFLDTERALNKQKSFLRKSDYSLKELAYKLDKYIDNMCSVAPLTYINTRRAKILDECRKKALHPPGIYTLTVPTGGGKTLSSLSFALRHAVSHGKNRVIYVIPYTSIIEQNAAVFRSVLGDNNILEHHSNFAYPDEELNESEAELSGDVWQRLKLAAENWDMPIIVTTNVQFFESLYASRSSRCRKLHNVANSVVIIDEAQMIPTGFLKPCLNAIVELVTNYNATVVLCTATQPAIARLLPKSIETVEIVEDPAELYEAFKRVEVIDAGPVTDDDLAEIITGHCQVLCIVNSKKHARLLFNKVKSEDSFHLSTRMCPVHRSEVLKEIKERLENGLNCRVISTQLIEAGVDVDFPVVYRSMAGLDSIAQSAGRCNREGSMKLGRVNVFWPEEHGMPRGWLKRTASLGQMVLERSDDPLGLEAVKDYFTLLYEIDDAELDKEGVLAEIKEREKQLEFPFRTLSDKFKLIDDRYTNTVIIPWDDLCRKILDEADRSRFPGRYSRMLQRYGIEVYENEFSELLKCGALRVVGGKFYVLREEICEQHYTQEIGLEPFTESMFLHDSLII